MCFVKVTYNAIFSVSLLFCVFLNFILIIRAFTHEKCHYQIVSRKYRIILCYANCALSLALDFSLAEKYRKGYNKEDAEGRGETHGSGIAFSGNAGVASRPQAALGSGVSPASGKNVHFCDACTFLSLAENLFLS